MSEIVFITGTSSSIDQVLARQYAAQGAMIGLVTRRISMFHEFVQTLPAGIQSCYRCYAADVRSAEPIRDVASVFIATVGLPGVVIVNAGTPVGTDLREPGDLKAFAVVMDTSWMGVLNTLQPFVGSVLAHAKLGQPGGTLVGITSVAGVRGLPGAAAYSASKSTMIKLMENLRVEFGPLGLHAVTIVPGYIRTPVTEHNPYPVPFLMPVDRFTLRVVNAIHHGVCFMVLPRPMGIVAKLLHVLSYGLYDFVFARARRKPRNSEISS